MSTAVATTSYSELELPELLQALNAEHGRAVRSARSAVDHAIRCGEMLVAAKVKVPHGQWESWLAENTEVSVRTSQRYMRLASNTTSMSLLDSDMGIAEALEMISGPAAPPAPAPKERPVTKTVSRSITSPKPAPVTVDAVILDKPTPAEAARLKELEGRIDDSLTNLADGDSELGEAFGRLVFVIITRNLKASEIHALADSMMTTYPLDRKEAPQP